MAEPGAQAAVAATPDEVLRSEADVNHDALRDPAAAPEPAHRNGLRPVASLPAVDPDERTAAADALRHQIDALSLSQALLDFEVANARVLDLTARLVEASRQVVELQTETDGLRSQIEDARNDVEQAEKRYRRVVASTSYRWANRLWKLRNALKG